MHRSDTPFETQFRTLARATRRSRRSTPSFLHARLPNSTLDIIDARLPNSTLDIIDAGHFTCEDGADAYAPLVTSWWGGGYAP